MKLPKKRLGFAFVVAVWALSNGGCAPPDRGVHFHPERTPQILSDWRLLEVREGALMPSPRVLAYELNSTLFSDYSHKLRTVWLPENTQATLDVDGAVRFPVGTILSKTFYYPLADGESERGASTGPLRVSRTAQADLEITAGGLPLEGLRLLETRLLVHRTGGWVTLPYVWNEAQTEATLEIIGDQLELTLVDQSSDLEPQAFLYIVPDANQCSGCHVTDHSAKKPLPIGPKIRHLNREVVHHGRTVQQLELWSEQGILPAIDAGSAPRAAIAFDQTTGSLDQRARAYLDINCGHCHNPEGPADTSGLFLDAGTEDLRRLGACKPPIAAGRGSGGRMVSIFPGRSAASIMTFRMASTDPGIAMPELGRSTNHREGIELITEWIDSLEGDCQPAMASGP